MLNVYFRPTKSEHGEHLLQTEELPEGYKDVQDVT